MPVVHFLNVNDGDCSIIQHLSGRVTVIDVCNASVPESVYVRNVKKSMRLSEKAVPGNFRQKENPDNPIDYLQKIGVNSIFRFIVTHPDMDHLDGINDLFSEFPVNCFWDTDNTKEFDPGKFDPGRYSKEDWDFYKRLRDGTPDKYPRRVYYSGSSLDYFRNDGISILAPTPELVETGNVVEDWNDACYVLLYRSGGFKFIFAGDSDDWTWKHILTNWKAAVTNVDVLFAPHHGRDSGRDYTFLKALNPKLVVLGNAKAGHINYDAWKKYGADLVTNNQAGYLVFNVTSSGIHIYVKNEEFARSRNSETFNSPHFDGWYLASITEPEN